MDSNQFKAREASRVGPFSQSMRQAAALVAVLSLVLAPMAWADRTELKPGWNMFSAQQDVEVGKEVSADAEKQLPMLRNSRVDTYVNNLGRRLATKAPGAEFPYQFKVVNDRAINAFALPGGYVYINRGVIEAATTESQLSGVIAHEISHVALRHGTNQASKASAAQVPLAILGGLMGSNSTGAILAQLGAGFAINSVMLKYSRAAESQADLMGTQILYDSKLDTRGMAQFFEVIQANSQGERQVEFFSNHPSPENRIEKVNNEISLLGGSMRGYQSDSRQFQDIKRYVLSLPAPPPSGTTQNLQNSPAPNQPNQPNQPSTRLKSFQNSALRIDYPENWLSYGQGDAATITPNGGMLNDNNGNQALAYGVIINIFEPNYNGDQYSQGLQGGGYGQGSTQNTMAELQQDTNRLIEALQQSNRNMRVTRNAAAIRVDNANAISTYLSNDSPIASVSRETNWLITMRRPEGVLFIVFVAPEREFQNYQSTFEQMLRSVRLGQ